MRQSLRLLANLVEVRVSRKHFVPEPVQVFRHRIGIGPDRQFVSTLISVRRFGKQLRVNQRYSMQWLMQISDQVKQPGHAYRTVLVVTDASNSTDIGSRAASQNFHRQIKLFQNVGLIRKLIWRQF